MKIATVAVVIDADPQLNYLSGESVASARSAARMEASSRANAGPILGAMTDDSFGKIRATVHLLGLYRIADP